MQPKTPQSNDFAIVGRGTPWDIIANDALASKRKFRPEPIIFCCESGLGASGFPHIGSFSDGARAFTVKLAAEDQGNPAKYIAYSDDLDGLRKVPAGMSAELEDYLAVPVSKIPDEFGCHDSFGSHMSSLLLESFDAAGIEYQFVSATELYRKGAYTSVISKILENFDRAGRIIAEETSQTKYTEVLPFHSICAECGRIYTTHPLEHVIGKNAVKYSCDGAEVSDRDIEGCGYRGYADYSIGEGKLGWKVEFAARWATLGIDFEAYGKDIFESVKANDRICREILGVEPPYHVRYEMFLQKEGKKMSKSAGGALTPQRWLQYGTSQSLMLLMLKRIEGSRNIGLEDIPIHMDELDELEAVYFGLRRAKNEAAQRKAKGLYEYCFLLKPPESPSIHVPYQLLTTLLRYAPVDKAEPFIFEKLDEYGYFSDEEDWKTAVAERRLEELPERFQKVRKHLPLVKNWVEKTVTSEETYFGFTNGQKIAINDLIPLLKKANTADEFQSAIFAVCKKNSLSPRELFPALYQIFIGTQKGPKLGPLLALMGSDAVIQKLTVILER
ncbi:MAG: lysine--tRNA ligase [Candidatus Heimdallarchaeota archaeon]